jgi:hypothetical protein
MGFWDDKKPKPENFATKDDIKRLGQDIEQLGKHNRVKTEGATGKVVKSVGKGFSDVAKSLGSAQNKRRMRIAQMPGSKPPIARTKVENPIAGRNAGMKRHHISNAPLD